jgi:hypothetical protein
MLPFRRINATGHHTYGNQCWLSQRLWHRGNERADPGPPARELEVDRVAGVTGMPTRHQVLQRGPTIHTPQAIAEHLPGHRALVVFPRWRSSVHSTLPRPLRTDSDPASVLPLP